MGFGIPAIHYEWLVGKGRHCCQLGGQEGSHAGTTAWGYGRLLSTAGVGGGNAGGNRERLSEKGNGEYIRRGCTTAEAHV